MAKYHDITGVGFALSNSHNNLAGPQGRQHTLTVHAADY
jgi:hypothetical protein